MPASAHAHDDAKAGVAAALVAKARTRSRAARLTAGTLLNAEQATADRLRAAIDASVDAAAADVARQQRDQERRIAAILAALVHHAESIEAKAKAAILDGRQNARREGARRIATELTAHGIIPDPGTMTGQVARSALLDGAPRRRDEDEIHASSAAASLAVAWRALAIVGVRKAIRRQESAPAAVEATRTSMRHRLERTAITETGQAFHDERREALADAMRIDEAFGARARAALGRQWHCLLDACDICVPHDLETVPIDEPFSGGDEPAAMHPRCRCFDEIVTL